MRAYNVGGIALSVCGFPSLSRPIVEALFRSSPTVPTTGGVCIETLAIDRNEVGSPAPDWVREAAAGLSSTSVPTMLYGPSGETAVVEADGQFLSYAWASGEGNRIWFAAYVPRRTTGPIPVSVQSVLLPMLREVFLARDRTLLHSAAVACPDGTGVVIFADGGGGKTTTALSVVRKGARLLSDDLIVVHAEEEEIRAFGISRPMNLTEQTIAFFEELNDSTGHANADSMSGRTAILPEQVYGPDRMIGSSRVDVGYFVKITQYGPAVRPLPAHDSLGRLVKAHTFARNQKMTGRSFSQLSSFLSQVKLYELHTGPDPTALGEWLIHRCGDHARRGGQRR